MARKGALDVIADVMRQKVAGGGATTHALERGLRLVLERRERRWSLRMGRLASTGRWPGDDEIAICRRAFKAPEDAEEERRTVAGRDARDGRTVAYNVVEVRWMEQGA